MRSVPCALLVAASVAGCYVASPGRDDASALDARAEDGTAPLDAAARDAVLIPDPEEAIALEHVRVSDGACVEWDEPAHPHPSIPPDARDIAVPLFRHRDEADPYIGNAAFASDGSIRLLGASARRFVRLERDGRVAWERDVGGHGYVWALAPDGSIFAAPSDDRDVRTRLVHVAPDGSIVGELAVGPGPLGLGIVNIAVGPEGRVYVSNGSLLATCRGERVEWTLSAFGLDRGERYLANLVVDESGAALVTVGGVTRVLRLSSSGERLEWMGQAIRSPELDPEWAGGVVTTVFGTQALVWAQIDSRGWMWTSLASPRAEPIDAPLTMALDGRGRLIRSDGTRRGAWIWAQDDGSTVTIDRPCVGSETPTFLEDGGLLCYAQDASGGAALRRLGPDGRVIWDFPVEHEVATPEVDLDGRVMFGERTGPYGETTLHVVQTTARPANRHWHGGRPLAQWARRR